MELFTKKNGEIKKQIALLLLFGFSAFFLCASGFLDCPRLGVLSQEERVLLSETGDSISSLPCHGEGLPNEETSDEGICECLADSKISETETALTFAKFIKLNIVYLFPTTNESKELFASGPSQKYFELSHFNVSDFLDKQNSIKLRI